MITDFGDVKFRAWDSQRNRWVYFALHEIILYLDSESSTDDEYAFKQLERVGRFTGFLDRHRKEIYEDDILSMPDIPVPETTTKFVVEWESGAFILRKLDDRDSVYLMHDHFDLIWFSAEVVGNRFELEENEQR